MTRGGIKCIIVGTSASMVSFYFSLFFIFKFLKPLCKTKGKEGRVLVFENPVSHRSLKNPRASTKNIDIITLDIGHEKSI